MAEVQLKSTALEAETEPLRSLLPALQRLDQLLERAVGLGKRVHGENAASDPYRGLYVDWGEMSRLLVRQPGAPLLHPGDNGHKTVTARKAGEESRLEWLRDVFSLSPFDVDLLLLALAPELDRRYERLYAFLQDHVNRRWPTVDLALNLFCSDAADRLERRRHFEPGAPLIRHGLLYLLPQDGPVLHSLLAHSLKLDEQILQFLLHQDGLDARLSSFCRMLVPSVGLHDLPLEASRRRALVGQVGSAWEENRPLLLHFHGPSGAGRRQTAAALAAQVSASLLAVDLDQALATGADFAATLRLVFRAAWFGGAILYLEGLDALLGADTQVPRRQLLDALAGDAGLTILAGTRPWLPAEQPPAGVLSVTFGPLAFEQRLAAWQASLAATDFSLSPNELAALASRFRLLPGQIAGAIASARQRAAWRVAAAGASDPAPCPALDDLFAAARAQTGHELAALTQKIEPVHGWADIVLPEDALAQLREICQRVVQRHRVLDGWGFDRRLSRGKGVNALFAGPSGTGKTMAAEIVAGELGLDLYRIDLSGVVSKYIGETEKNLNRIFAAAENANAILFFDEADALFGKRSEVRDSHDRYANIEISYLLQEMEQYEGVAILATNLRQNLDEAFVRRLAFTVHFPFPDEASRRRIWAGIWPAETPLAADADLDALAHRFKLSGGNIRNVALAAAFLAAADGGVVGMDHLLRATQREYQKLGRPLNLAELEPLTAGGGQP